MPTQRPFPGTRIESTPPVRQVAEFCSHCNKPLTEAHEGPDGFSYCPACFEMLFRQCCHCQEYIVREDGRISSNGTFYCDYCYDSMFTQCYGCGREVNRGRATVGPDNEHYCARCFDRRFFVCDNCEETFHQRERFRTPGDSYYCDECFHDLCVNCSGCGNPLWNDSAQWSDDRPYCRDCYRPSSEWEMGSFTVSDSHYDRIGSRRRFGVELETYRCPDHNVLNGHTIWECKHDCSIEGMEFVSPILYGDEGLEEIERFCQRAEELHFEVSRQCGYHAHFDVSTESTDSLKAIAYAYRRTYEVWCSLVPNSRSDNRYCGSPDYESSDITHEDFDYFVGKRDRFEFVNWRAYLVHGSVEVRLYQGSLDAEEICNWLILHARFIDFVKDKSFSELDSLFHNTPREDFVAIAEIIGPELAEYWIRKSEEWHKSLRPQPARRAPQRPFAWVVDAPRREAFYYDLDEAPH